MTPSQTDTQELIREFHWNNAALSETREIA